MKTGPLPLIILTVLITAGTAEMQNNTMVLIPAGTFDMGSTTGQKDEKPVHRVRVDSFYMGTTEVTIWEYLKCVEAGKCRMPYWWNRRFFPDKGDDLPGKEWLNLPVTGVSWEDAVTYCKWMGPAYRLPTEAEWEYAARGGTSTVYFWGDRYDSAALYAVITKRLSSVKSARPNNYGLYDMLGNAWEWCHDRYDPRYYQNEYSVNPQGPTDVKKYPFRVVRGGSWNEYRWNLRSANRNYGEPFRRFEGVGFRICRSAEVK